MPNFKIERTDTIVTVYTLSVYADDELTAKIRASVGPMSFVKDREGVEIEGTKTDEKTSVKVIGQTS